MAIVKSEQFEPFLARLPRNTALFLLHGTDSDLASERARRLATALVDDVADPFQITRLSADALAKDPGRLADEASAISMFGGRRVIWIEAGARDLSGLVAAAAEALAEGASIVVEADNLRKGTPLRDWFEARPNAASIECYPPPPASLAQMIDTEARAAGVRVDRETRDELVAALSAEPATARSELAKLMLYAQSAGAVEPGDVETVVAGGGTSPADALIDLALSGDLAALERGVMHGLTDGAEAALVATRLAARVALLLELRQGGGEDRLNRMPFAARRAAAAQANALAPEALARRLPALLNLLISTRRTPTLGQAAAFRALLAFAYEAKRAAR